MRKDNDKRVKRLGYQVGELKDGSKKPKALEWLQLVNPLGEGASAITHQPGLFSKPPRFGISATDA